MSFGDQNNPYGAPQQPAPGYGYPQQAPQPYGAYPQAPGGYPMAQGPLVMPGITKAARVLMYVIAVIHVALAGLFVYMVAKVSEAKDTIEPGRTVTDANGNQVDLDKALDIGKGAISFFAFLALAFAVVGIILAIRYGKGRNGVRVGSIVYASFAIISGIFTFPLLGLGLLTLILAILVIVFAAKQASAQWFQRPRY